MKIQKVLATEILDSRGTPTVGATVILSDGSVGTANAPSGASTGKFEAHEKRDNDRKRYLGRGVKKAVEGIEETVAPVLENMQRVTVQNVDRMLIELDNTKNKEKLGANATLAVSLAVAKALAAHYKQPFFRYLGGTNAQKLPVPMMNILNGGKHADNTVDFQEFMIMPVGAKDEDGTFIFREGLQWCVEVYHTLKKILEKEGYVTAVGDEGGFAPDLKDAEEVLDYLMRAVREAGYEPGSQIAFALDVAASELYNKDSALYDFPGESRRKEAELLAVENSCECNSVKEILHTSDEKLPKAEINGKLADTISTTVHRTTAEMIDYYEKLIDKYPIISIEDGLHENDWEGWTEMTKRIGDRVQLVGDDLFVTNPKRLREGIRKKAGNAILIKVNQIGTLSESFEAIVTAKRSGYQTIVSHRSGETEDSIIADIAVALNCGQIKTGAPCRGERTAKYNQLLRIEEAVLR